MMEKKEKKFKDVMAQFMKTMHRFKKLEETPMDFGTGDILCRSEIHAIEAIEQNHGGNLTELAAGLEVTKGTLSPLISKLVKKGLVIKKKGDRNDKEISLRLTEKGKMAFDGHVRFHRNIYLNFMKIYQDISLEQLDAFEDLLIKFKNNVDQYADGKTIGTSGLEMEP